MGGSRQPGASDHVSGVNSVATAPRSESSDCVDRRYFDGGKALSKSQQQIDKKLEGIVDAEIIPRLMLIHRREPSAATANGAALSKDDVHGLVDDFVTLMLSSETAAISVFVDTLKKKGADTETILLHLFAPAARKLGKLWETDEVDFVDVTVAISCLQQILYGITMPPKPKNADPARRVLLLPTPTEQHTFGLLMVSNFFRREGWEVWGGVPLGEDELLDLVAEQWFALVGFSLSSERLIGRLEQTVLDIRQRSRNQHVKIMAGGRVFSENLNLSGNLKVDLVTADAHEALTLADDVVQDPKIRQSS